MKKLLYAVVGATAIALTTLAANYALVGRTLENAIKSDTRNSGIEASAHYDKYFLPSTLVFAMPRDNFFRVSLIAIFLAACSSEYQPDFHRMCEQQNHQYGQAAVLDCKARLNGYRNDREMALLTKGPNPDFAITDEQLELSMRHREKLCLNDVACRKLMEQEPGR
jgi:hypothetical protein